MRTFAGAFLNNIEMKLSKVISPIVACFLALFASSSCTNSSDESGVYGVYCTEELVTYEDKALVEQMAGAVREAVKTDGLTYRSSSLDSNCRCRQSVQRILRRCLQGVHHYLILASEFLTGRGRPPQADY